jgi:hypothetical protein
MIYCFSDATSHSWGRSRDNDAIEQYAFLVTWPESQLCTAARACNLFWSTFSLPYRTWYTISLVSTSIDFSVGSNNDVVVVWELFNNLAEICSK